MTATNPGWTNYTAAEAVARAESYSSWQTAMCMNFVWYQLSYPDLYGIADANAGWDRAERKHTGSDRDDPPPGAPVYWSTDHPYGHVALAVGGRKVRSTDWPNTGDVGTVSIEAMTNAWGMDLLGWTEDLCGDQIPGLMGDDDMPLSDDDLDKIAARVWSRDIGDVPASTIMVRINPGERGILPAVASAVWGYATTSAIDGSRTAIENILRWAHLEAHQAGDNH